MRMLFKSFFLSLLGLLSLYGIVFSNQILEDTTILRSLIYPQGYDIKTNKEEKYDIFTITYKVKTEYPSKDVLDYYDEELAKLGWALYFKPPYYTANKEWSEFVDATQKGEPLVHQLLAFWINKDKTKGALLGLRYYTYNYELESNFGYHRPENNLQIVVFQIMPFIELPQSISVPPENSIRAGKGQE